MLKESAGEKEMLCIFNSDTVAEGCVSDIFQKKKKKKKKKKKTSEDRMVWILSKLRNVILLARVLRGINIQVLNDYTF